MNHITQWIGWILMAIGGVLTLVGIATWPPGGLMFALPYVFLLPGVPLAMLGAVLVILRRRKVTGLRTRVRNGTRCESTEQPH
jgi:hypothetical protein